MDVVAVSTSDRVDNSLGYVHCQLMNLQYEEMGVG